MYDVIIVGAGPAGSTCARWCAKQRLKTLLLDRDEFPRPKPCGGAVSDLTFSYLDFPVPAGTIGKECFGARISHSGRGVRIRKKERMAVLVSRDAFDMLLLEKAREAGADFIPREQAEEVTVHRDFVEVRTGKSAYRAAYVVGADGVHSRVAHLLRPPFKKDEMMLALVSRVPADNGEIDARLSGDLEMHFGIVPMGYGWVFPHHGYYSVGIGGLASAFHDPRKALTEFARSMGMRLGDIHGHFIPLGGMKRKVASGRVLLAGDAAGFADPFHGEGISYAVLSGKLAAQAVGEAVHGNRGAVALGRYESECERRIRRNLSVALRLARLIERFPDTFVRIFLDNRKALDRYLDIPLGRFEYKQFQRWLLLRAPYYLLTSYLKEIV